MSARKKTRYGIEVMGARAPKWCVDILAPKLTNRDFKGSLKEARRLCKAFEMWNPHDTYTVKRYSK